MKLSKRNVCLIEAYKKGYYVDDNGNVISPHGRELKLKNEGGYLRFYMLSDIYNTTYPVSVHRFIAYHKFGESLFLKGIQVRHLDNNSLNNLWDNIDIGTQSENMMDIPRKNRIKKAKLAAKKLRKFTNEEIKTIRKEHQNGIPYSQLIKKYNVAKSTISYIINNITYKTKND